MAVWICLTIIDKKQPTPNKSLSRLRKNVTFHEASARPGHLPAEGPSYHRSIFDGRGCNLQTKMCIVDVYAGFIWMYCGCSIMDVSDSKIMFEISLVNNHRSTDKKQVRVIRSPRFSLPSHLPTADTTVVGTEECWRDP